MEVVVEVLLPLGHGHHGMVLEVHLLHQGVDVLVLLEVVLWARVIKDAQLNERQSRTWNI